MEGIGSWCVFVCNDKVCFCSKFYLWLRPPEGPTAATLTVVFVLARRQIFSFLNVETKVSLVS